ncbi:MAG: sodium transporter, partial [Bacteroidetes bacterium]|nr:sodium transporter [Bacteroidota bacterium]
NAEGVYEIPFIDRMALVFILCVMGMALISVYENKKGVNPQGLEIDKKMFKMQPAFLVGALIVCGILAALYTRFW